MRGRLGPWLVMALLAGGCNQDCPAGAAPAAACVRVALDTLGRVLMVITPDCGIVDADVRVDSMLAGTSFTVHVDAEGRSSAQFIPLGTQDQLTLTWGGDCKTHFCAQITGPGPARECTGFADAAPE